MLTFLYRGGGDFFKMCQCVLLLGEMMKFDHYTCRWVETPVT